MYNLRLTIQKFNLIKAMNLLVKSMDNEDAYYDWINIVPDQASDDDLISIASSVDDAVFREACHEFRRICHEYIDDGFFCGGYPGPFGLYGAKDDEEMDKRNREEDSNE